MSYYQYITSNTTVYHYILKYIVYQYSINMIYKLKVGRPVDVMGVYNLKFKYLD